MRTEKRTSSVTLCMKILALATDPQTRVRRFFDRAWGCLSRWLPVFHSRIGRYVAVLKISKQIKAIFCFKPSIIDNDFKEQ